MRNILILHNNNLPRSIIELCDNSPEEFSFTGIPISQPTVSTDSFDVFISAALSMEIGTKTYDIIILPYSFSTDNVLAYDGLVCACHLRLDESLCNTRTPFLFLGPDNPMEAAKIDSVGTILFTDKAFSTSSANACSLIDFLNQRPSLFERLDDVQYSKAVSALNIPAPNNFGDSKHAITNLWSLLRWRDMISWEGNDVPELSQETLEFKNSLYFKWSEALLRVRYGEARQEWTKNKKKKRPIPPSITNIESKTILHIDDEGPKGWYSFFECVFRRSKAKYIPFSDFRQNEKKDEFIQRVKDFINSYKDVDCYIIDLRLHESDVSEKDFSKLSGHEIAKHIYGKNFGNQVILFSASDKIWNLKQSEQYISDYALKENPSRFLSRDESASLFESFSKSIETACKQSYLRGYAENTDKNSLLEDFTLLLKNDLGKGNQLYIRPAALNLIVFIEAYIKERFEFDPWDTNQVRKIQDKSLVCDLGLLFCQTDSQTDSSKKIVDIREFNRSELHPGWEPIRSNDLGLILSVLYKYYSITKEYVLKVSELKSIRNTSLAHKAKKSSLAHDRKETPIPLDFLRQIFEEVVLSMLKCDNSS